MKQIRTRISILFFCFLALCMPQTLLAASHTYIVSEVVKPTCTKSGYTLYTCTDCGSVKKTDSVPKMGHDYQISEQTDPTCAKNGSILSVCSRCQSQKKTTVPKRAHTYEENVTEPTCTKAGKIQNICTGCGKKTTLQKLPALGHDFEEKEYLDPTCSKTGYISYICRRCQKTRKDTLDKLSHHFVKVTVPATCTKAGKIQEKCENCSKVKETITLKAPGHDYRETGRTEPTCKKAGSMIYTCTACSKTRKEAIPKRLHNYEEVTTEPTCTKKGKIQTKCSVCGSVCNTVTLPPTGHLFTQTEINGTVVKICSICGKQ